MGWLLASWKFANMFAGGRTDAPARSGTGAAAFWRVGHRVDTPCHGIGMVENLSKNMSQVLALELLSRIMKAGTLRSG